jgi:DNA-binding NarL/FixJ family response regulator
MANVVGRRILVIEDHAPWRRQIASVLRGGGWHVVGEGADGLEGIQKAEALRPDVVIVDVELPALNGLEAARHILTRGFSSRILFVSAHRSWDIAAAALGTGASGYILKSDVGRELLPAMDALVRGKPFISAVLTGRPLNTTEQERHPRRPRCHQAAFYSEDAILLDAFVRFAAAALEAGRTVIVIAVESRRNELRQKLRAHGVDIGHVVEDGRYVSVDVADTLSAFMVGGWPDEARFWKMGASLIADAASASRGTHPLVAAYGECAASLLSDGMVDAAIRLEQLWSELASTYNVDVLCGYSERLLRHHEGTDVLRRIREEHSGVLSR